MTAYIDTCGREAAEERISVLSEAGEALRGMLAFDLDAMLADERFQAPPHGIVATPLCDPCFLCLYLS